MTKNVMNNVKKWSCVAFWVALFTLYSYWTWTSQLNDFGGDSAVYLLTAQHWSLWGEVNPAAAYFALTTSFPPLYPLLLSLFSGGHSWLVAHQVTGFCGVTALLFIWRLLRHSGVPLIESLVAIAVIAMIPGFYMQALYIHSEFLFLMFVALCLYSAARLEQERKPTYIVIASLAAVGAYLTRSVGISMVAALLAFVLLCRPKKEWLIVLALAVVPMLAWMQFGQPPGGGYLATWKERLSIVGAPSIASILGTQFVALVDGYRENFVGQGSINTIALVLFSIPCFVAWVVRLCQHKLDALFLGAYLAILLVWPFPAERVRFIAPIVPVLVMQLLLAFRSLKVTGVPNAPIMATRLALLLLVIVVLPTFLLTIQRHFEEVPAPFASYRQSPEWYGLGTRDQRLSTIFQYQRLSMGFEEVRDFVPSQDCVYSIKSPLVGLLAQRRSLRSPLPTSPLGMTLDAKETECRYVHMLPFASPTFAEPFYPMNKWGGGMDIVHATRLVESDSNSPVVGLLAKIR
jgi:Dolichyl-phosphate-mannose-protein mannosyltransferase